MHLLIIIAYFAIRSGPVEGRFTFVDMRLRKLVPRDGYLAKGAFDGVNE